MASKLPPVKNEALTFSTVLYAQADNQIKTTPTLAAGDVKISKDNGAIANPGTLPVEDPASSGIVKIVLTATEMNADEVVINFVDASGDEWHSQTIVLHTVAAAKQFDDMPSAIDNADATLIRGVSNTEGTADTTSLTALILATLESSVSGTTWTIRKTGGTTFVAKTVTVDAAADPIIGVT